MKFHWWIRTYLPRGMCHNLFWLLECTDLFGSVFLKGEAGIGCKEQKFLLNGVKEVTGHLGQGTVSPALPLSLLCH